MITARLLRAAAARLKPWRARHPPHEHVAPLGLACALLLYALILVADSDVDRIGFQVSSPQSWLKSDVEPALAAVQASMVELPSQIEAAMVAQLANKIQMMLLENRQLAAELRALQADYAELEYGHEADFAELQRSIDRMHIEIRGLLNQQENLENHAKAAMAARHPVDILTSPNFPYNQLLEGVRMSVEDHELGRGVANVPDAADTVNSYAFLHPENARSPLTATDQPVGPSMRPIALQIARSLEGTRREAMLSKQERAFAVDVDGRLFQASSASAPVLLDFNVNLGFSTARSELTGPRSGRIRFFPDGSSTGGRIDLELYGSRATVMVDWSTGVVTVEG